MQYAFFRNTYVHILFCNTSYNLSVQLTQTMFAGVYLVLEYNEGSIEVKLTNSKETFLKLDKYVFDIAERVCISRF